ncbi:lantibiotic dehydratase [Hymenobacter rubripertinctus]|uniref:Lantibiotic dehydratase n=1 Tax=Hymenobacter rubripertinctus TaxID=2029981 RepID=A0A418QPP1_9BACT|nr:lantibiotic dehydratase [Hymenobacter rubripertinctus]RIY07144.1 hypothetical protein D0T11_17215 [Hymenobacter rubripertinctus]
MDQELSFPPFLVLRTPSLPFAAGNALSTSALRIAYQSPLLQEALFLASPALSEMVATWLFEPKLMSMKGQQKLELTLRKYLLRMSFRCTPFGLFAGITQADWGEITQFHLNSISQAQRRTRLDMDYLCALATSITQDLNLRQQIPFSPNNTLYTVGGRYRYVEYSIHQKSRTHGLVSVDRSPHLEQLLADASATGGVLPTTLAAALVDDELCLEETTAFLDDLIDAQVLLSGLEPLVTGNFMQHLIDTLQRTESGQPIARHLEDVCRQLTQLDTAPAGEATFLYEQVRDSVQALNVNFEPNQLFQVDLYKTSTVATVSRDLQEEIRNVTKLLRIIQPTQENINVKQFCTAFLARYEQREVPLSEVLDVEMGLGYPFTPVYTGDYTPLLEDLYFGTAKTEATTFSWSAWHQLVLEKYATTLQQGRTTLEIVDADVQGLQQEDHNPLPSAMFFSGALLQSDGQAADEATLACRFIGGPSSANLLGRFCHLSSDLLAAVRTELQAEEAEYPEAVFAEIVHINQARIGNVSTRPVLRQYEIPIMAQPGVDAEHTLPLQDLMVAVRRGKIVLRSKKLNRQVIPRLSSAHNYSHNTLPAYRFLCDLQSHGTTSSLAWSWGSLQHAEFLPRVIYRRTILASAQWVLKQVELQPIRVARGAALQAAINTLRAARRLPQLLVSGKGDNKLPIDLENEYSIALFQSLLPSQGNMVVEECLFTSPHFTVSGPEGNFTNEILIPLHFTKKPGTAREVLAPMVQSVPTRQFSIGSEWLYLKLYCGINTADEMLSEVISPLTERLTAADIVDQWFFIRYTDPHHHLRVRFKGKAAFYGIVIRELSQLLAPYLETGLLKTIQTDTYTRELERYGNENIMDSEALFYHDSRAMVNILALLSTDDGDRVRWLLALRSIDTLLEDFGYDLNRKYQLLNRLQASFKAEFNSTHAAAKKQYGTKFRQNRAAVESILNTRLDESSELYPALLVLAERSRAWHPVVKRILARQQAATLSVPLDDLLCSYIHMTVNRFFRSKQRMYETVLYDLLFQNYASQKARTDKKPASPLIH